MSKKPVNDFFPNLPASIKDGIAYFMDRLDQEGGYERTHDGVLIGSCGTGIIKQAGQPGANAILIKHDDNNKYLDFPMVTLADGTRILCYHQEDPSQNGATARNNALKKNIESKQLVGIWDKQRTKSNEKAKYIMGIGLPIAHVNEHFILALPNDAGDIHDDVATVLLNLVYSLSHQLH